MAKTVRVYRCDCGEDVYEDDGECVNCGVLADKSRLKEEEVPEVISETYEPRPAPPGGAP